MTNEAFIEKATDYLVMRNKIQEDQLRNPTISDTKVVCFEIEPGSNVMMVLDSQTGERLFAQFGPDRFLKQGHTRASGKVEMCL
jgi:hypothetical protein